MAYRVRWYFNRFTMIIQKLSHSCVRLEKDGVLLIDPGSFFAAELGAESVGQLDAIIVTHGHADHFDEALVRDFGERGTRIYAPVDMLPKIPGAHALRPGDVLDVAGFGIRILRGPHGALPFPIPDNLAILVDDGAFLHPGDALNYEAPPIELLALPYAAPWCTMNDAVATARRVAPQRVIPIHDGQYKPTFRASQAANLGRALVASGIRVQDVAPDERIVV